MKLAWMMAGLLAAGAALLPAQDQPQAQNPAELTGIAHVALRVSDVDREANFFGKLGFEEAFSQVLGGRALAVVLKINDHQFIEVFPRTEAAQRLGLMRVGYETANLKALRDHYRAEGLRPSLVQPSPDNDIVFSLRGPDQQEAEFVQYLPQGRQMLDRGEHLGELRVSNELIGFEMPVHDLPAAQNFYEKLGFAASREGHNARLTLPANGDLRIELHPPHGDDQPQFLFPVDDARHTADQLKKKGLHVEREEGLVFVNDPDGNQFVFLQTGQPSRRHFLPWRR